MGGGFLIDFITTLQPVTYFTPQKVLEFCRELQKEDSYGTVQRG